MQFVPPPVLLIPITGLHSQTALVGQFVHHRLQFYLALLMHPRTCLRRVFRLAPFVPLVRPAPSSFGPSLGFRFSRLVRCWLPLLGKSLPHLNRRRIAGDVADQAVLLRLPDQRLMHKLGQLHARKFIEGTRKSRFMRHLPGLFPTTDPPELWVAVERLQQLPGGLEPVHRFGHESTSDRQPVLRRSAHPTSTAGYVAR